MLFKNEVFGRVMTGRPLTAWVKQVRDDGKLDLTLQKPGWPGWTMPVSDPAAPAKAGGQPGGG
jgi:hypothetical protein